MLERALISVSFTGASGDPVSTVSPDTSQKNSIHDAIPIQDNDPRFGEYKAFADLLQHWMNNTVDPCDDFYAFTCGAGKPDQLTAFGLSDNAIADAIITQLRKPEALFDNQPLPIRQMKWFYDVCLGGATTEDRAAHFVRMFNDLRSANPGFGFPALFPDDPVSVSPSLLAAFLGYSAGSNGLNSLVDVIVATDWMDPHNPSGGYSLFIDQPSPMFAPAFYAKSYDRDAVVDMIVGTLEAATHLLGVPAGDPMDFRRDAQDIAQFDYDLATKYSTDETTREQHARSYNPSTIAALQQQAPFLDWKSFLERALVSVNAKVDGNFRSIVMEVANLERLSADISSGVIAARIISNYLYFTILNRNDLPVPRARHEKLDAFQRRERPMNIRIRTETRADHRGFEFMTTAFSDREKSCQSATTRYLSWASTRLYVDAIYPTPKDRQIIREQTNTIVRSIVAAFRAQIDLLDWMSLASKKGAYQKIDNLVVNIAFPDWVLDDGRLAEYYKNLNTTKQSTYLEHVDQLEDFQLYETFSHLLRRSAVDRTDFGGPSAITSAWYQPELNSITVPGGILHTPFYDANLPAAVNYGGLGAIAGRELSRAFDAQGAQWQESGVLLNWMDANSTKAFGVMAQCVVDEYGRFCPLGMGQPCVDGRQTQDDNIADNGGAEELGMGNASSVQGVQGARTPAPYRVLGTVRNIPAFQNAFNCPTGSTYAPVQHCDVWTSQPTGGAPLNERGEPKVSESAVNVAAVQRISAQNLTKYSAYQNALATMKAATNLSIDPCDDFYHYACGNYPGKSFALNDQNHVNFKVISDKLKDEDYQATIKSSEALSKLKTLYTACKAEKLHPTIAINDYFKPKMLNFRNYINQDVPLIGGTGTSYMTPENYGQVLGFLSFQLGIDTLVSPGVDTYWPDPQATKAETTGGYQLFVDQASTYNQRAFYEDDNWKEQKPAYKSAVMTILEAYVRQDGTVRLAVDYDAMVDAALELEKAIAITYSGSVTDRRRFARQWNPLSLAEFPLAVDWRAYWAMAPREANEWVKTKPVVLCEVEKTAQLFAFLDAHHENDGTVVNYLFIRLLLANSGLIPCASGECAAAVSKLSSHVAARSSRVPILPSFAAVEDEEEEDAVGERCASSLTVMNFAQGRVYIDARIPTEEELRNIREAAMGLMTNVIGAMKGMIMQLDWMGEDAKAAAVNKADHVHVNIAYPDFIVDNAQLDAKYADLSFASDDSYYAMLDAVTLFNINDPFKALAAPKADRTQFIGRMVHADAIYQFELNSISLAVGVLQQPFFDVDYPAGLNYGILGVVAGHELTHGFDDQGVQWDADGRLNSWMDKESQDGFNNMAECVIEEYDTFCPLPGDRSPHCIDGTTTQGENIADNGGMHSGWRAYQSHVELVGPDPVFMDRVYGEFTEDQMYFLNFARMWCMQKSFLTEEYVSSRLITDTHSIGPYRVLGTVQNIPAFQTAFNCPKGSTYAPEKHCAVWVTSKVD